MTIRNKKRIISTSIILIVSVIIAIIVVFCIKLKNSYIFKIRDAFIKTLNAESTSFIFNYQSNENAIIADGDIEYNFEGLELLGTADSNNGKLAIKVSKENSTIAYYIEKIEYWVTIDVTDIALDILEQISKIGKKSVEEEFPVEMILKLIEIDEKIDISKYPNKLTRKFIIEFLDTNFLDNTLKYVEKRENNYVTYMMTPNIYELLIKFIDAADLSHEDKNKLINDLEKKKDELEQIDLTLSITIDDLGYITKFMYMKKENEYISKIEINLDNFNNTKVEIEEDLLEKINK